MTASNHQGSVEGHTRGPWVTDFLHGQRTVVKGPQRFPICCTNTAPWGQANVRREEANARLIAAAPELYEVCRQIEKRALSSAAALRIGATKHADEVTRQTHIVCAEMLEYLAEEARAAIAKAGGAG